MARESEQPIRSLCLASPVAARQELERIGVDPAGIAKMLPKLGQQALLIKNVRAVAANILKQEMLSLGGDAAVARGTVACSVSATDVLLIGNHKQLIGLCEKLKQQPFGLKQTSESLATHLHQHRPSHWQTSRRRIELDHPLIMGILNVTPDSFSDGGKFTDIEYAVDHALQLEAEGADLIDIGGESTRPGAPAVSENEERDRVVPVIRALEGKLSIPISVDTWKSSVADAALSAGAEIINDISGLSFDPALAEIAARHHAGLVLMHTRGIPQDMQRNTNYADLMGEVTAFLQNAARTALDAGVLPDQIAIDPGICFAKDLSGNLELLQRLSELHCLGYPLLVGTSRKSFIGTVLHHNTPTDRLFGTAATVSVAVCHGAQILRVHDVAAMRDVAIMTQAIQNHSATTGSDL